MDRAPHSLASRAAPNEVAENWVVVIEPNFTGHRWRYVQWIIEACAEAGYPCLVVTEVANEDHRLAREVVAANRPDLQIAFVDEEDPSRRRRLARISYVRFHRYFQRAFALVSHAQPVQLVVVPYGDYFFYALPFLGSPFGATDWIAITMRATFHHHKVGIRTPNRPLVNAIKTLLFRQAVRTPGLRTLLSIDPTLPEWFAHRPPKRSAEVVYLADPFPDAPAPSRALARERLGLDQQARYLLVYGAISERKGICELVEAVAGLKDAPTLLIAGEQDTQIRGFMRAFTPHLKPQAVVLDRFISNEVECDLFSACDAVWLGYKGHYGMSGVLVQAYRFGKPVIATADGLIGWFTRNGQLGPCLDDLSPAAIAGALDELAVRWRDAPLSQQAPQPPSLLARNTLDQFKATLRQAICQVSQAPGRR